MKAMTSRERLLSALRRQPVDYVPCSVAFNPLYPVQRKPGWNFPWPQGCPIEQRIAYQVEQLGLDQTVPTRPNLCRPHPDVTSRVWLEGDVLHKAYATLAGELHAAIRYNDLWAHGQDIPFDSDFTVGHFVKPWIQTEADLACFKYVFQLDESGQTLRASRQEFDRARRLADRYRLAVTAFIGDGLTGAQRVMGAEPLCVMTVENPGLIDAWLEHEHRITMRTIETLADWGADIFDRNGFYETADFYGPKTLERFVGPLIRREMDAARSLGMVALYTIHTGIMPILDYLATLKTDALFGIDIAFHGIDLTQVRDRLGTTNGFWIGPSSTFHLWKGPEATRRAVQKVFEVFPRHGLVLGPGVSAHSIMPWESTLAMIDEWKKLRSPGA